MEFQSEPALCFGVDAKVLFKPFNVEGARNDFGEGFALMSLRVICGNHVPLVPIAPVEMIRVKI